MIISATPPVLQILERANHGRDHGYWTWMPPASKQIGICYWPVCWVLVEWLFWNLTSIK